MALYLVISEGSAPGALRPVVATADRRVIAAALAAIGRLADPKAAQPATSSASGKRRKAA